MPFEDFPQPLSVFLVFPGKNISFDVTSQHLFLGYKPLVLALISKDEAADQYFRANEITLDFYQSGSHPDFIHNRNPDHNRVARLRLKRIMPGISVDKNVSFYVGERGSHSFLKGFHQWVNHQRQKLRKDISGNVALEGNLYDQVRISYSIPRMISLITLGEGDQMNMFPTDLHGAASNATYISSLRIGGKANDQVENFKTVAISNINVQAFEFVYSMGKNHMRDLQPRETFSLSDVGSHLHGLPLPKPVLSYRELALRNSFDVGIHRIHLYNILHRENVSAGYTLSHIHQYYAQWRSDHGIRTHILMRSR